MLVLYIGNKNYSSWSLRPWLLLRHAGLPFEERRLSLFSDAFRREIAAVSPAGRVPVLVDEGFAVWDSLAIAEYLAEKFPALRLWPEHTRERARARSVCAEMHSGFSALRQALPMNVEAHLPGIGLDKPGVQADLERIVSMWSELRATHGGAGPFLFGHFSIADAFYAPVVLRLRTYAPPLPEPVRHYMDTMLALPQMREWIAAACAEREFLPADEPYRTAGDQHLHPR